MKKILITLILLLIIVLVGYGQRANKAGGREIELQENAGWVEWRYVGAVLWEQLYEISAGVGGADIISGLGMDFITNDSVDLGLPSTITSNTINEVTETSHTHALGNIALEDVVSGSPVEYGALYNWPAATDARKITSSDDWVVPTDTQFEALYTEIGGKSTSAPKLREVGTTHWSVDNLNTNEYGFNARGNGRRSDSTGEFLEFKAKWSSWISVSLNSTLAYFTYLVFNSNTIQLSADYKDTGHGIRLLYTGAGTPTIYTGNNGKVYPVVQIGAQYWIACNLNETKYRNGDWITGFDGGVYTPISNAAWAALTTEAMCYYSDNEAYGGGETPLEALLHPPVTIAPASAALASIDENQVLTISTQSSGDVYQAGTQYNNQVPVWTNDSTIEGTNDFMFDGLNLTVTGTTTGENFILSSDRRLKKSIQPIGNVKWIDDIHFVSFYMKNDMQGKLRYGVIAQDVQNVNPYLINKDEQGMMSVAYIDLLIAKVARQDEVIRGLLDRIEKLEK